MKTHWNYRFRPLSLSIFFFLVMPILIQAEEGKAGVIKNGSKVSIEYTLVLEDGTVINSNVGQEPLIYTQGEKQILPALERELVGLRTDDTKKVKLSPEEAYGPVHPDLFKEVEPEVIPEDARQEGLLLEVRGADEKTLTARVHEVHKDKIILDFNHPLAGKTLQFDVHVTDVQ